MAVYSDDGTMRPELKRFYDLVSQAADTTGWSPHISVERSNLFTGRGFGMAKFLKPLIEKAGFTNVHHQMAKIPIGPWAADRKQKEMGAYILLSADSGFEAFGIQLFTNVLGMASEEAQELIKETLRQAKSRKIHSYGLQ